MQPLLVASFREWVSNGVLSGLTNHPRGVMKLISHMQMNQAVYKEVIKINYKQYNSKSLGFLSLSLLISIMGMKVPTSLHSVEKYMRY